MPENFSRDDRATSTPPKTSGNSFGQRKDDIYKRLLYSAGQCRMKYNGRKELAAEKDEIVAELCEALEETVTYGLRIQQTSSVTANLFQNMQEIVTGNIGGSSSSDTTFWDFCQLHLTAHERERYLNLKQVWTKPGRGKAFIRATLNEHSLQRYFLTWLSVEDQLQRYYSPWSLLMDTEIGKELPKIVGSLNDVLFALTVDSLDLNANTRNSSTGSALLRKEEPVILVPTPIPVTTVKNKRKGNAVERPIATANSTEDLLTALREASQVELQQTKTSLSVASAMEELVIDTDENLVHTPPDPIEPELEFLKEPLPDFSFEYQSNQQITFGNIATATAHNNTVIAASEADDKSETSSQYSKSSSAISASHANCASNNALLEEKLREMSERCALLETRVAQLSLENRQLVRRLTQHFNESGIDPSSSLTTNFLITIPNVKLLKSKRGGSFYSYEIHITMRQHLEHWLLQRRYREFYKLHKSLLKTHPSVAVVEFPPKKHFGNMNLVFVEERRQQLQIYLLNLVEMLPQVEACKSKSELQKAFPFFRER